MEQLIADGPQNGLYKPSTDYGSGTPMLRIDDYQNDWLRPRDELRLVRVTERFKQLWKLAIVGRHLIVSDKANPSPELRVVELGALRDLLGRAAQMFEAVDIGDKASLESEIQKWLTYFGLTWPACVESLDSRLAIDLRDAE